MPGRLTYQLLVEKHPVIEFQRIYNPFSETREGIFLRKQFVHKSFEIEMNPNFGMP
jgi:hypothetical protein